VWSLLNTVKIDSQIIDAGTMTFRVLTTSSPPIAVPL
jgi:hypothetical protein